MTGLAPLPDVTADEQTTLTQFLDYYRVVLRRKAEGIDEAGARLRLPPSTLDLLGLIRHMAAVEYWWFATVFTGADQPGPYDDESDADIDFHHTEADTMTESLATFDIEVRRAQAIIAAVGSLDELTAIDVGPLDNPARRGRRSMRWILVHMIEEYARHCGHADLLREAVDGTVDD